MELNDKKTTEVVAPINCLSSYMGELSKIKLLSNDESARLFEKMHRWVKSDNPSSKIIKDGKEAREKLVTSNLRLVIKIAKEFRNTGLDYEDLISEGNLGLMTAVDKYDPDKGAKLSYYSSFWIKQFIRRAISNKGRTIRLPVGLVETKLKIQRTIDEFTKESGEVPTNAQIASIADISLKKVNKIIKINLQCESLNSIISEDDSELSNVIVNEKAQSPLSYCVKSDDKGTLRAFLRGLDKRERYIIIRRFGLDGAKPETLEVIGKKFNLTRERIRQLELSALRGLRDMYKKINKSKFIE